MSYSTTNNATFLTLIDSYRKGSQKAFSRLYQLMSFDMKAIAYNYAVINAPKGNFFDDYLQEASLGLERAAKTYREEKGSFRTYARNCMQNAVRGYIKGGQSLIVLKEGVTENIAKIRKGETRLLSQGMVSPSKEELFLASGIASRKTFEHAYAARELLKVSCLDASLNGDEDEEGSSFLSTLADSSSLEEDYVEASLHRDFLSALKKLSKEDRAIVVLSYGLLGYEERTNKEICKVVGLSEVSVISHRKKALSFLSSMLSDWAA